LHISLDKAQEVAVYNASGQLVYKAQLPAGDIAKVLPKGLYVVQTSSGEVVKVLL